MHITIKVTIIPFVSSSKNPLTIQSITRYIDNSSIATVITPNINEINVSANEKQ